MVLVGVSGGRNLNTGDGQNNGNTTVYRNKTVCIGLSERTLVVSFLILLFMLCSATVNALYRLCFIRVHMTVLVTFSEDRLLVHI